MTTALAPVHAALVRMKVPVLCIAVLLLAAGALFGIAWGETVGVIALFKALPQSWVYAIGVGLQRFIGTKNHPNHLYLAVFIPLMLISVVVPETETRRRVGSAIRARVHSAEASLAAAVAGKRHAHLRSEWTAHLAGPSDSGTELSARERDAYAVGFLVAAVRIRLSDTTRPLWRPVDWVLRSDGRVNAVVASCCGAVAGYLIDCDGPRVFLSTDCVGVGVIGTGAFAFLRWLRAKRGIELTQLARRAETPREPFPK
ncbi:hypothetical protein [Streptomyces sp. NPDC001604]|uniref:hypothetical protein n=1 Tax=Streptomyces sp. NPDC001604 TaxID=3364593 RepID=UPI0036A295E4